MSTKRDQIREILAEFAVWVESDKPNDTFGPATATDMILGIFDSEEA